jgi:uroporphyrinogen-III synthase
MQGLRPFRVLVTRPSPQGETLCAALDAAGYTPIFFPVIEIKPLNNALLYSQIATVDQYTWAIFVSRPAVTLGASLFQKQGLQFPKQVKIAAVGEGTAQALQEARLPVTVYPARWNSEGLLALPEFQDVSGQKIAIFAGQGGRELLATTLSARGAEVVQFSLYERILPSRDKTFVQDLLKKQALDAITCTSVQTLVHLQLLWNSEYLQKIPLVLISERIMIQAKAQGFKICILAKDASHNGILQALQTIRN